MYTNRDIALFDENIDNLEDRLQETINKKIYPTYDVKMQLSRIVLDFVKNKKRKIYGGYAQNAVIVKKNKDDAFYEENTVPDIDFYSPTPIEDAMELSNIFVEKGFQRIQAAEAQHKETYRVFVEFEIVADISYVPRNIYNRIPFIEIDGFYYTSPKFFYIDFYKILTDIAMGGFRWRKTFPRIFLMQEHYPISNPKSRFNLPASVNPTIKKLGGIIEEFIKKNKETIFVTGDYAYNYFLKESKLKKPKLETHRYELILMDYETTGKEIYSILKKENDSVKIVEHYPLFTIIGHHSVITVDDYPILTIVDYNKRCTPVKRLPDITLVSYDQFILSCLSMRYKYYVVEDKKNIGHYDKLIGDVIEMRNFYFKNTSKTMLDDTLFQQFITDCTGELFDAGRESRLRINERVEKGKRAKWDYWPEKRGIQEPKTDYKFSNTSGNPITNANNLKILS